MTAEANLKESEGCLISAKKEIGWIGKANQMGFFQNFYKENANDR